MAGAFVIIAEPSRSQDPSISASGPFPLRLLNRARLCICNRQRQVLIARPRQEQQQPPPQTQTQPLNASRPLEARVSAGRFGFALPRRPVLVFPSLLRPAAESRRCLYILLAAAARHRPIRCLFWYHGESRLLDHLLSLLSALLCSIMFASACFASAAGKERGRESPPSPVIFSLKQLLRPKNAAYCPTTTTCLVQTLVFFFFFFAFLFFFFAFAYDFLLGTVLAVISCVSLQPVSSNPGDKPLLACPGWCLPSGAASPFCPL